MIIINPERSHTFIDVLTTLWEASVRATHHFLTEKDIQNLVPVVKRGLSGIETLVVAFERSIPTAFMGIHADKIEMLFVSPDSFGKGIGRELAELGITRYGVRYVDVNEQNPEAAGFYRHIGFEVFERTEMDEEGNPFPILKMKLQKINHLLPQKQIASMNIQHFIQNYQEAFGVCAPLPLLFFYSHTPLAKTEKINGCFFKSLSRVREGKPVSLNAEVIGCGGGKFYTGFSPMSPYIPAFVSTKERYKQTPDMVTDYIAQLEVKQTDKKYLNFVRIDQAESFERMEGLLFFATPDILSGLCTWAFFDTNAPDAVTTLFGSGCSTVVTTAVQENRRNGQRTFLGLFDPSVRPYVGANELSFVIPRCRFQTMYHTMEQSCLFGTPAWAKVRDRIPGTLPASFHIRRLERSEYPQAIALSLDVFITCGKADFNEEGLETFKSFIYNEQLMNELALYGAFEEKELVGILGTKNGGTHISLFFINPERQKKGIGKALFQYMTAVGPVAEITVNSSTYAVPFYSALGFTPLGEAQCFHGLTSIPMKRIKFHP